MPPLEHLQAAMAATLAHGPGQLQPWLFAGPQDRLLLGLKAHANTISHARLVALEDTFPHTREAMGHGEFHRLSRAYLDVPGTTARSLANIGLGFPGFLAGQGNCHQDVDLARTEWAWLMAWRAADARPFALADIAGLTQSALLATPVAVHPAARLISLREPAGASFRVFGNVAGARILLVSRPDTRVVMTAVEPAARAFIARARAIGAARRLTIGDLLLRLLEDAADEDPAAAFLALAEAGAFAEA